MPRLTKHKARLCKLIWAENELLVLRSQITRKVAPKAAKKIRSCLKSIQGAIRYSNRLIQHRGEDE